MSSQYLYNCYEMLPKVYFTWQEKLVESTVLTITNTNSIQIMNVYECNGTNIFMR